MERKCDPMGARVLTTRFSYVLVSAIRQAGAAVGIGMVYRNRDGANVRKVGYAVDGISPEQATYEAVLTALREAANAGVRGMTVYIDNPQVVDQLNRRARVPAELQSLFVQVRCLANGLGRARFRGAKATQSFAARRLARAATLDRQPLNIDYGNIPLRLSLGDESML